VAFEAGLHQLGWIEGKTIRIAYRWYAGDPALAHSMAKELIEFEPDVLVAGGTPGLAAVHERSGTIPIVFVGVSDPVGQGFVDNLARPGGNITGFTLYEFGVAGKWLGILKEAAPHIQSVGLVFNPDTRSNAAYVPAFVATAPRLALELIREPVRSAREIEDAIGRLGRKGDAGLVFPPDPFTSFHHELITGLAARYRLPAIYGALLFKQAGLISYGVDQADLFGQAASYVDRVLRGTNPGSLPIQLPTKYQLVINLKTAKAIGIELPATLVLRADEVIE
jgi:putative ABC transport system substrate-binding protein